MAINPIKVRWSELTHEGVRRANQSRQCFSIGASQLSCRRMASRNGVDNLKEAVVIVNLLNIQALAEA